jgi:hypothetical protein
MRPFGSKLTANWFLEISADVFISHSHKDSDLAIGLAGFLRYHFDLNSFIDSSVWGYGERLLKIIDNEYCWQKATRTYNYQMRNRSTSHVYMMLSTALSKLMHRCECTIFLNTPASIPYDDYIKGDITDSPWIYSEIAMTTMLQKRTPQDHRRSSEMAVDETLMILYEVNLTHLTELESSDLVRWEELCPELPGSHCSRYSLWNQVM